MQLGRKSELRNIRPKLLSMTPKGSRALPVRADCGVGYSSGSRRRYALMGKKESDIAVKRHAVNFMYDAPPGMEKKDGDAKLELDADRQLRLDEKFQVLKVSPSPFQCTIFDLT